MLKLGSLFDGIGGWPLAAIKFGINPVWSSEIEPFPQEITKTHFPSMKHLGDITKINGAEIEPVDIITLGSPCQDLSIAGKREGLDGERSGLFKDAMRIVREMRVATNEKYPRFVVWENVPGAFSSNKGHDFRTVLEEITETSIPMPKSGRWATAGMVRSNKCEVAWRVLDAKYWGVPQRRKRIFLVADFTGQCAGEILFKSESLPGDIATGSGKRKRTAGSITDSLGKSSTGIAYSFDSLSSNSMKSKNPHSGCRIVEIAKCLDTTYPDPSKNQGGIGILQPVTFSVGNLVRGADAAPDNSGVCKTLRADMGDQHPCICLNDQGGQSININYGLAPTLRSELHGNHPSDEVMRPVKDGIVPTLNARMGTGGNQVPVVQEPVYCIQGNTIDRNSKQNGSGICKEVAHTLTSTDMHGVAYCIQGSMIGGTDKNGPQGNGINEDVSFTLNTIDRHTVAYCVGNGQLDQAKLSDKVGALNCMHDQQAILSNRTVRRLTPTECERLQGLPDIWEVDIGIMNTDEYIAFNLSVGNIFVDCDTGDVFSARGPGGIKLRTPRKLKGCVINGYLTYAIRNGEIKKPCRANRVVWISANGVIPKGMVVDHINNNKLDNRLENLQILSPEANSHKAKKDGLYLSGDNNPASKLSTEQKIKIFIEYKEGKTSYTKLAEKYKISKSRIAQIIKKDGYTLIDDKKCSDSARYKALGNGMAQPCPDFIMEGIASVFRRDNLG